MIEGDFAEDHVRAAEPMDRRHAVVFRDEEFLAVGADIGERDDVVAAGGRQHVGDFLRRGEILLFAQFEFLRMDGGREHDAQQGRADGGSKQVHGCAQVKRTVGVGIRLPRGSYEQRRSRAEP